MGIDQMKELFDYDRWATERLWQAVAGLNVDQLNSDISNGIGSVLTTLVHLVNATWTWRTRWQGGMLTSALAKEDFPTLPSIYTRWQEEEAHLHRFLMTLADLDLGQVVRYSRLSAPEHVLTLPLWKAMLHLINHQTQHRSEIAMHLTALNHSPGELGMSNFFHR